MSGSPVLIPPCDAALSCHTQTVSAACRRFTCVDEREPSGIILTGNNPYSGAGTNTNINPFRPERASGTTDYEVDKRV